MVAIERAALVCRLARAAGFERAGIAPAGEIARAAYLEEWLSRGWAGEMEYLGRWRALRRDVRRVLEGAKSVIVVAHVYRHEGQRDGGTEGRRDGEKERRNDGEMGLPGTGEQAASRKPQAAVGRIAQYAWGRDYHRVMRKKLHRLVGEMRREMGETFEARVCVDTAPVVEREVAVAAGVGWIGKNTLAMHEELGSFFFLGEVITTLDLAPSTPAVDRCGTCTRCLKACPTGALVAPYQMDARRCISYLTIEHRREIPAELQGQMRDWLYGCDVCQDVCPYNRKAPTTREETYAPGANPLTPRVEVEKVMAMTEEEYRAAVAGSAMKRASLEMLKRNAAVVKVNVTADGDRAGRNSR